jgi:hypothetical protein
VIVAPLGSVSTVDPRDSFVSGSVVGAGGALVVAVAAMVAGV